MNLKLQTAAPSDNDIFEGKSHEAVAIKMAEVIKKTDINIIGLEGELGTGKSTIIKFLMDKLEGDFHFITFDAERYHYGSTKKSLIEIIYKGMHGVEGVNTESLENYKDKALGNVVEYEKKVNSRVSWWTVSFILLSLLSVQMVRYFLIDINNYINPADPKKTLSIWVVIFELIGLISPAILLVALAGLRYYRKRKGNLSSTFINTGDLFKRNSTDTISEKWLVSREIGTIELTEALEGFTKRETITENCRFILIIDNLDRVSGDKVKELWSDMELITGVTHAQFRVVVPYSARQVAKSLSVEGHSGQEFIAKRIPVSFSVPPLISAGWQSAFAVLWKETVSDEDNTSCHEVSQLLERWRPTEYNQITPRLMKKLVNDTHILALTVPQEEIHRHVLIALYILTVRYGGLNIRDLLKVQSVAEASDENAVSQDPVLDDKMKATLKQLSKIFINKTDRWSEYLMSVHYQTGIELARSELIDTPLVEAINSKDPEKMLHLIEIWGFHTAWQRCIDRFSISDWFVTAAGLPDIALKSVSPLLLHGAHILDSQYALTSREDFRSDFSEAINKFIKNDYIPVSDFVKRQKNFIVRALTAAQKNEINDDTKVTGLLKEANIYSDVFGVNLINEIESEINGHFYVKYLMPQSEILGLLEVGKIDLSDDGIKEMFISYLAEPEGKDIFNPEIIKHIGISTYAVKTLTDKSDDLFPALITATMNNMKQGLQIPDYTSFRMLVLNSEWHVSDLTGLYTYQKEMLTKYPVEFHAQKMAHMIAVKKFIDLDSYEKYKENSEFSMLLSNYLVYLDDLDTVLSSLQNKDVAPVVFSAIKIIIEEKRVKSMSPITYNILHYDYMKKMIPEFNHLVFTVQRQRWFVEKLDLVNFMKLSNNFVADAISSKQLENSKNRFKELTISSFSSKELMYKLFSELNKNIEIIFEDFIENDNLVYIDDIKSFSEWYKNHPVEELQKAYNVHQVWSVLDKEQQAEIIKDLEDILHERETLIERRVALIHDFYHEVRFTESEGKRERRAIAALFPASKDDSVLREWLDSQTFHFNKWNSEDSATITHHIINHQNEFPNTCKNSVFIKNRIKQVEDANYEDS